MRLIIEFNKKYKNLFYELVKATQSTIVDEPESWMDYPEHVRTGIKKSLEQVKNGQTKTYEEVKKILADRHLKD